MVQAQPEVAAETEKHLECGKTCAKALPCCPHVCQHACHAGACPGEADCREEVAVRCGCRRRKERMRCCAVQAALAAASGGGGSYIAATQLRLLPCNELCEAQKVSVSLVACSPAAASLNVISQTALCQEQCTLSPVCMRMQVQQQVKLQEDESKSEPVMSVPAKSVHSSGPPPAEAGNTRVRRMNKEERLKERVQAQTLEQRQARRMRQWATAKKWAIKAAWLMLFVGLVWGVFSLLNAQDRQYQAKVKGEL